jgi:hypothetical protein
MIMKRLICPSKQNGGDQFELNMNEINEEY